LTIVKEGGKGWRRGRGIGEKRRQGKGRESGSKEGGG